MLFDLQSPGRRRVVRVVFGALAILFAISFIAFGIGGSGANITDVFNFGGGSNDNPQADEIEDAENALKENPNDTAALSELVTLNYQASNTQRDVVDASTGETVLTSEGEESLQQAGDAWARLVKLTKGSPDPSTAIIAVQVFSTLGRELLIQAAGGSGEGALADADDSLANYKDAALAQQIVAAKDSSPEQLAQVAAFFYLAADYEAGDAAAQKAVAASPGATGEKLQKSLDAAEKQARQINDQIEAFRKQLAKSSGGGATGGGENPLSGIGGGGLSGGGLATP